MRIVYTLVIILMGSTIGMAQTVKKANSSEPLSAAPTLQFQAIPATVPVSKKDVPPAVVSSYLSQNSSGATDSVWLKESITIYKVNYKDNGQQYEAQYFSDGRWIKTYAEIDQIALPLTVTKRIGEMFPKHKIAKAYVELNNDGKFYATDLINGGDKLTVYFTMGGKFVK